MKALGQLPPPPAPAPPKMRSAPSESDFRAKGQCSLSSFCSTPTWRVLPYRRRQRPHRRSFCAIFFLHQKCVCVCVCVCVCGSQRVCVCATNAQFWCITHDLLTRLLKFELTENNMLQAVGTLWQREGSIPMGALFSAQSADLHTLWKVKRAGKKLRDWGALNISDEGYVYWQRVRCGLASASFGTTFCLRRTKNRGHTPTSSRLWLKPFPVCESSKSSARVQTGGGTAAWETA